jgi:YMGG-like Gly-zipper
MRQLTNNILPSVVGLSLVMVIAGGCGTVTGAAAGGAAGAGIGAATHSSVGRSAAIGAGVGGAAGAVYDLYQHGRNDD